MIKRISIGVAILSLATAAVAGATGGLTDLMQTSRMTVVKVDGATGAFLCAEPGSGPPSRAATSPG